MNKKVFANNLFHIIDAEILRSTPNVLFMNVPIVDGLSAIDYVEHQSNAISPSISGMENKIFWYMHTHQEDNLFVINGTRLVELWSPECEKVEKFEVTKNYIKWNGELIHEGMCMFGWPKFVFHRVNSGESGSQSINYASYYNTSETKEEIMKTNFNIYSLDVETGRYDIARHGFIDQPNIKK